ncbi:MAG TPA: hypothetical protein VN133_05140 [Humibacter sp.]|nr:hypothetical protein [Humibacter sp.]
MLDHDEVVRRYGPWKRQTPRDAAIRFAGYEGQWWVAGGWAIDAYVGTLREHGDLDIGIPRETVETLIGFVSPGLEVWAAAGSLTPLLPGVDEVPDRCGNLWLRAGGTRAWQYDVMLESVQSDTWTFKRDRRICRPLADCLWEQQGLRYLRPEVQLLLKAKNTRPKDDFDFERCLPLLEDSDLGWLENCLRAAHPGHHWIESIRLKRALNHHGTG